MKPEESVRPSIVLCGAQKVRKALLRKAGEFAVGSPKLQRAEAAISGRHMSEEVDGLHRRITEALQDERHEVLGGIPPCRVRLVLVVDVCRGCSAGFLSAEPEFGHVYRVRVGEAHVDVDETTPSPGRGNANVEPGLVDRRTLAGPGIRRRRELVVPRRYALFGKNGHARMPPFQRPCQPVANQVVEFEDDPTNLTTSGMSTSQIKRRPAELSCSCPVIRAEDVFAVRGWRRL